MDARQKINTIRGLSSYVRSCMKNAEVQRGFGIFHIKRLLIVDVIYSIFSRTSILRKKCDSFACRQIKGKFVAYRFLLIGFFSAIVRKFLFV